LSVRYVVVSAAAAAGDGIEATSGLRIIDRRCVTRQDNQRIPINEMTVSALLYIP